MNVLTPYAIKRMSEIYVSFFGLAAVAAYILGPFLLKIRANKYWRTLVYYLAGAGGGAWYAQTIGAANGLPPYDLSIAQSILMHIIAMVMIAWVVLAKNRKSKRTTTN